MVRKEMLGEILQMTARVSLSLETLEQVPIVLGLLRQSV